MSKDTYLEIQKSRDNCYRAGCKILHFHYTNLLKRERGMLEGRRGYGGVVCKWWWDPQDVDLYFVFLFLVLFLRQHSHSAQWWQDQTLEPSGPGSSASWLLVSHCAVSLERFQLINRSDICEVCPESIQPRNMKNRDIFWRRHMI